MRRNKVQVDLIDKTHVENDFKTSLINFYNELNRLVTILENKRTELLSSGDFMKHSYRIHLINKAIKKANSEMNKVKKGFGLSKEMRAIDKRTKELKSYVLKEFASN